MFQLKQNIVTNIPSLGYQPNFLIEYLQSLFGENQLQFWMTSLTGKMYMIYVVNKNIFYYFTYEGKMAETHAMPLIEIGRIHEKYDSVNYSVFIYDSGGREFLSVGATDAGLIINYRNLVKLLLAGR